jgi:hypothetical protein
MLALDAPGGSCRLEARREIVRRAKCPARPYSSRSKSDEAGERRHALHARIDAEPDPDSSFVNLPSSLSPSVLAPDTVDAARHLFPNALPDPSTLSASRQTRLDVLSASK